MVKLFSYIDYLSKSTVVSSLDQVVDSIETEILFEIIYYKDQVRNQKLKHFEGKRIRRLIVVTHPLNYEYLPESIAGLEVVRLKEEQVSSLDVAASGVASLLDGSLFLLTSNNFARIGPQKMCDIFAKTPHTIFAVHDFDNHHWHTLSLQSAMFADVYVPAHLGDFSAVSRINSDLLLGVPCGSLQWSAEFALQNLERFSEAPRHSSPLGYHSYYQRFKYRNSNLATLNQQYPTVGILTRDFFGQPPQSRWDEWASHSVHWVAPVFNDLPIRFFDALLTGGIPLVPINLRPYLELLDIPKAYFSFYRPSDLLDASVVVESAVNQFVDHGVAGIRERSMFCLNRFHANKNIEKIKSWVEGNFCLNSRAT
jgi:hypothetical protein